MTLNAVLIGGGSVLARCGEVLVAKGHRIVAVVTGDATARSWAMKAGVPHHDPAAAVDLASRLSCDLLLSIGNYAVVPGALLDRAERAAVNYHYGPLPEYSGLHTPSWAIADGAREYGITHVMLANWGFKDLATLRTNALLFDDIDELRWNGPTKDFASFAEKIEEPRLSQRAQELAKTL